MVNIWMDLTSRADNKEEKRTGPMKLGSEQDESTMIMTEYRMPDLCKQCCISIVPLQFSAW